MFLSIRWVGQKTKKPSHVEKTELHSHPWCKAVDAAPVDWRDVFIISGKCRDHLQSSYGATIFAAAFMQPPCYPSGKHKIYIYVQNKHLSQHIALKKKRSFLKVYPVFKIREVSSSSATPETWRSTPGWHERTLAQWATSASTWRHEASAAETPPSSIVSQRDAERLWIHSPLFCPSRPSLPDTHTHAHIYQHLFWIY